nr:hypothetical protein [uncultured Desulfobulbus sp.]
MIVINPQKVHPVSGIVIAKKDGLYRIRIRSGKVMTATSSVSWNIGMEVTVLSGEIIGAAGRSKSAKVFRV